MVFSPLTRRPDPSPSTPGASRRSFVLAHRWRQLLAAGCAALIVLVGYLGVRDTLTSHWVRTFRVVAELPAGTTLTADQVESVAVPPGLLPPDALSEDATPVGSTLTRPVGIGDVLTRGRLTTSDRAWQATPSTRLITIPASHADTPAMGFGAKVDLIATADASLIGTGTVVDVLMPTGQGGLGGAPPTSRVQVAVDVSLLGRIARAMGSTGGVTLAAHPTTPPGGKLLPS